MLCTSFFYRFSFILNPCCIGKRVPNVLLFCVNQKTKKILFAAAPLLILLFVGFAGRPPPADPAYTENGSLYLGNPSGAVQDEQNHADNYLMIKNTYALSYNNAALQPNWIKLIMCSSWSKRFTNLGPEP